MTDNVYQAPGTAFNAGRDSDDLLRRGTEGRYSYGAFEVLGEAWNAIEGKKGTLWLAGLLTIVVAIGLQIAFALVGAVVGAGGMFAMMSGHPGAAAAAGGVFVLFMFALGQNLVQWLVMLPLQGGVFMLSLKLLTGQRGEVGEVFSYFSKALSLLLMFILQCILVGIGFICLILPGIYLAVSYRMAAQLIVEKDLGPWEALESSRQAITHNWWSVFGTYILVFLMALVTAVPIIVAAIVVAVMHGGFFLSAVVILAAIVAEIMVAIWALPYYNLIEATMYHRVFGCESELAQIQGEPA